MSRMFWWFTAALVAASLVWAWVALPSDGVPQQTDFDGTVTRYGTRVEFIGAMAGVAILLLVVMPIITTWAMRGDAPFLNLPHKDYWMAPERAETTRTHMGSLMSQFYGVTNLLLVAGVAETVLQATSGSGAIFVWAFPAFVVYTVIWCVVLFTRYGRIPE